MRRYRAGLLKDHGHVADLLALTGLLAEDKPLFAAACPMHSSERRTSLPQNTGVERPLFNSVIDRFRSGPVGRFQRTCPIKSKFLHVTLLAALG